MRKRNQSCALAPSPIAVVELGQLSPRRPEIGEQPAQRLGTLYADVWPVHAAVIHVHGLDGDSVVRMKLMQMVRGASSSRGTDRTRLCALRSCAVARWLHGSTFARRSLSGFLA